MLVSRVIQNAGPPQLNPRIGGRELPVRLGVVRVAGILPGGNFFSQGLLVCDAAIETLRRQHAELTLSHVEPASMLGRVVPVEPLNQPARLVAQCHGKFGVVEIRIWWA